MPTPKSHLPITTKDLKKLGWDYLDVVLVTGDAYIDHPSFGAAVISRILESLGLRVGIVSQPNWKDDLRDFKKLGTPRYFFAVTSGNMDSMVNHYTASKRKRSNDAYTANGETGFRPDYATTVYTKILKSLYPDTPILLGGIEASLRRVTHYDYWSDTLKASILHETQADLLVYGMGEKPIKEIVKLLKKGVPMSSLHNIPQTAILLPKAKAIPVDKRWKTKTIHSHEDCLSDPKKYARNFAVIEKQSNSVRADRITQQIGEQILIINPPYEPDINNELDQSFDLPFTRLPHPKYASRGPIPCFEMIKNSITLHRGCFGGCSFCTISAHQGKFISSRSKKSIMTELEQIVESPDFNGTITDMGGPSANMYKMQGRDLEMCNRCSSPSCIHPVICNNLNTDHYPLLDIYKSVLANKKVKHAFVGSGLRYDLLLESERKNPKYNNYHESHEPFIKQLLQKHVSGRLKVAPEHSSDAVLKVMRKPSYKLFEKFQAIFNKHNSQMGLQQQIIPYFISSHPGSHPGDMLDLALKTKKTGFKLEQVQDFTPTPMTVATVIYYSGYHPITMKKIYTARNTRQKQEQKQFFFWYKKEHQKSIKSLMQKTGLQKYIPGLFSND